MNIKIGGDVQIVSEEPVSVEKALASNPDIIVNDDYQPTPGELIITEHAHQAELFRWAASHEDEYPELRWMYAIPNGGMRHPAVGRMLKKEGVKPGIPDIHLPVPKQGYHGLWIELKKEGGTPSPYQLEWINALNEMGHNAVICWGWEHAGEVLVKYLESE